jgi:hypothetical protein
MPATERKIAPTFVGSATFSRITTRRASASRDSGDGSAGRSIAATVPRWRS